MNWFTATDVRELQSVSEGLLKDTATLLRVVGSIADEEIAEIKCRVFPPGVMNSQYRNLVPTHLRGIPIGAIEVRLADGNSHAIAAKDRLIVNSRLFEVIAPLSGRTIEIRRKLIVREIQQPERELYLALKPEGYDGGSVDEALPTLVRVLPIPFIADKQVETIAEREGSGAEIARLKQVEVSEIAIEYFSEANRARLLYCLVVISNTAPTAAQARDRVFPRYMFNGSPSFENAQWSSSFPWCVALVEER